MVELFLLNIVFPTLGLFVGSFLGVVVIRGYRGGSILVGRSFCDKCKKPLSFWQLIPVFSYIFLKGKCGYCHKKIGLFFPTIEVVTGLCFGAIWGFWGNKTNLGGLGLLGLLGLFIIASTLIVTFFADLKYGVIYREVILVGVVAVVGIWVIGGIRDIGEIKNQLLEDPIGKYLLQNGYLVGVVKGLIIAKAWDLFGAVATFLFFYILHKAFKGKAMGRGDADLGFLIGLICGFPNIFIALFISFLTGAIFGLILIAVKVKGLKDRLPFGPFLVVGCVVVLVFGKEILNWYLKLL